MNKFSPIPLSSLVLAILALAMVKSPAQTADVQDSDKATTSTESYSFPEPGNTLLIEGDEELFEMTESHGSDLLVVNFWATWCSPCVKELPYFVKLSKEYPKQRVQFVGYSLDMPDQIESTVDPFLKKHEIPYPNFVIFVDANETIPKFSEEWTGAIPATFFYDSQGRKVAEILSETDYDELKKTIEKHLPET